jgi:hypothetical protein
MWVSSVGYKDDSRIVKSTKLEDILVSTVFLSVDHKYDKYGPPMVFETMVFGGKMNEHQERYSTWNEAITGHEMIVKMVKETEEFDFVVSNALGIKLENEVESKNDQRYRKRICLRS